MFSDMMIDANALAGTIPSYAAMMAKSGHLRIERCKLDFASWGTGLQTLDDKGQREAHSRAMQVLNEAAQMDCKHGLHTVVRDIEDALAARFTNNYTETDHVILQSKTVSGRLQFTHSDAPPHEERE